MVFGRLGVRVFAVGLSAVFGASAALADCTTDVQKLTQDRMAAFKVINETVAAAKGKQIDPGVFCVKSRPLVASDEKLLAYITKNQEWCGIPQTMIDQLKQARGKDGVMNANACKVAEQMKKAQESGAAANAPPPLPAGPL